MVKSEIAEKLYGYVSGLPIVDYHNHLSLGEIKTNKRYTDIYELWIQPDPYKHRAMRMCGVEEYFITGAASNKEKFVKWCETVPRLIGNPLYQWSLAELETVFGITAVPCAENAGKLYDLCNGYLSENVLSVSSLLEKFGVEYACPCASLVDDISVFAENAVLSPSLRGDDIVNLSEDFVAKLETVTGIKIESLDDFEKAVGVRLEEFKKAGCSFSDHALDNGFRFYADDGGNEKRFALMLSGEIGKEDKEKLASYILVYLGRQYAKRGFVMQLHIGAQRYTSTRLRNMVGPAGGFAGIGNSVDAVSLTDFLDVLDSSEYGLPKTVLFTLNPADNALISVLSGSYSKDGISGIVTQGPAWWWCDHKLGITDVLENTAVFGVLSNFIGMTTDSRSFLSFVRHDYFRKILCDWIGEKVSRGDFPDDIDALKNLVYKMCYKNAVDVVKETK